MQTYLSSCIGQTPLVPIRCSVSDRVHIWAKLEMFNPTGSVKDRAAQYILTQLMEQGIIRSDMILIESSSGNFGIALAAFAKMLGLKFWCVIDPNINSINEQIIRCLAERVIKVDKPDEKGGYLLTRLRTIETLQKEHDNICWINQYANPLNMEAYYCTLGLELCDEIAPIDYAFIGVSSGGTIAGVSRRIKERYPNCKIIAVDAVGSIIFGGLPKKRYLPGIGSSITPSILQYAFIDEVIHIRENEAASCCYQLLRENQILAGGSSGMVLRAIQQYFTCPLETDVNVVTIFPDRGERYIDTVFNNDWCKQFNVTK